MNILYLITNLGKIIREYPDNWQYDNKDLNKLLRPQEVVIAAIMAEKKENQKSI